MSIDQEEYLISCTFEDKIRKCTLNILISQVDENVLAVEFMKQSGYYMHFYENVKIIKNYLYFLQESSGKTKPKKDIPNNK